MTNSDPSLRLRTEQPLCATASPPQATNFSSNLLKQSECLFKKGKKKKKRGACESNLFILPSENNVAFDGKQSSVFSLLEPVAIS